MKANETVALTEADTCRIHVTPALQQAGWSAEPYAIGEQRPITDGGILLIGGKARRAKVRKPDYISTAATSLLPWLKPRKVACRRRTACNRFANTRKCSNCASPTRPMVCKAGKKTVYRLAQQGEIPGFKLGGTWRFRRSELDRWIAAQIAEKTQDRT